MIIPKQAMDSVMKKLAKHLNAPAQSSFRSSKKSISNARKSARKSIGFTSSETGLQSKKAEVDVLLINRLTVQVNWHRMADLSSLFHYQL